MLLQKRPSANDSLVFIFSWGAWYGEQVLFTGKRWRAKHSNACFSKATLLLSDRAECSSGWAILGCLHLRSSLPALPLSCVWGCTAGSLWSLLRGERLMCCSNLQDFMASLCGGYQFQGPSQGKREMHILGKSTISCGFWPKHEFPHSPWRSEMHPSWKAEPYSCFTGDGGAVKQGPPFSDLRARTGPIFYSALYPQKANLILTWTVPNFARLQQPPRH